VHKGVGGCKGKREDTGKFSLTMIYQKEEKKQTDRGNRLGARFPPDINSIEMKLVEKEVL
jgi:hypothetical protein